MLTFGAEFCLSLSARSCLRSAIFQVLLSQLGWMMEYGLNYKEVVIDIPCLVQRFSA